jgi:hypothetical protein
MTQRLKAMSRASMMQKKNREFYRRAEKQTKKARGSVNGEAVGMNEEGKAPQKGKITRWRW